MPTPEDEVRYADGKVAQAAYWWFKMLTDPTQGRARVDAGFESDRVFSEAEAFKIAFDNFASEVLSATQDPKYVIKGGHILNAHTYEPIPKEEPIFILRAKDIHALPMLLNYASHCKAEHIDAVKEQIAIFMKFSEQHPEVMKEPDTK